MQVGIISALAFSTDYSGLYAAGSFSGSVSLYQEDHDGSVGHIDGIEPGGVTQVCLDPMSCAMTYEEASISSPIA